MGFSKLSRNVFTRLCTAFVELHAAFETFEGKAYDVRQPILEMSVIFVIGIQIIAKLTIDLRFRQLSESIAAMSTSSADLELIS